MHLEGDGAAAVSDLPTQLEGVEQRDGLEQPPRKRKKAAKAALLEALAAVDRQPETVTADVEQSATLVATEDSQPPPPG